MKRSVLYIVIVLLAFQSGLKAQSCPPFDILFESQSQIDSFPILYPDCRVIEGNLAIDGWDAGDDAIVSLDSLFRITEIQGDLTIMNTFELNSLRGLEGITSVGGRVYIAFTSLDSVAGLDNLQYVGESLQIAQNSSMQNLHSLKRLQHVGDGLAVMSCGPIQNLNGLDSLSYIGQYLLLGYLYQFTSMQGMDRIKKISGYLKIENLPLLTDLHGLETIDTIAEDLILTNNQSLRSLTGLDNLKDLGGGVYIRENPLLVNIDELRHLKTLAFGISIKSNASLQNISGLDSITHINNYNIHITSNASLTDISGIRNIDAGSVYFLEIASNPLLSICAYESTCNYLQNNPGFSNIALNAPGCNSDYEVLAQCETLGDDSGFAGDGIQIIPSPATESALIRFCLSESALVKLDIINGPGEVVTSLLNRVLPAGDHHAVWLPGNLSAGFYLCRIQVNHRKWIRKILYIP